MTAHALTFDELITIAFNDTELPREDARAIHIAGCDECQTTLRLVGAARSTLTIDAQAVPSAHALSRVLGLIDQRKPRAIEQANPIRRLFAALTFDSRAGYATAGLRGKSDSYLLSYEQETATLDLEITPSSHESNSVWHITGQLDHPGQRSSADIAIIGGRGASVATHCDEFGVFSFAVEPGMYDLFVSLDDSTLVFPEVEVGERDQS